MFRGESQGVLDRLGEGWGGCGGVAVPRSSAATSRDTSALPRSLDPPVPGGALLPLALFTGVETGLGLIDSVSVATIRALEEAFQAVVVGMRLDAVYADHPEVRQSEDEIARMAERAGLSCRKCDRRARRPGCTFGAAPRPASHSRSWRFCAAPFSVVLGRRTPRLLTDSASNEPEHPRGTARPRDDR